MDFQTSQACIDLQNEAALFSQQFISPQSAQWAIDHDIPEETLQNLGERSWLGINIPKPLGGLEMGAMGYVHCLREIAKGDASLAVTMAVTNMVSEVINEFGTEKQKSQFIPSLVKGKFYGGAFGLSEPSAGSDPSAMKTKAIKTSQGWEINGSKMWITTGDRAGVHIVWAKVADEQGQTGKGHKSISCFLVPGDAKGLSAGKSEEKMGLNASHTVTMNLDKVVVPENALLGHLGQGFEIAMTALDGGRIGIGAQSLGMGYAALEGCAEFLNQVKASGSKVEQWQEFALADMKTELEAAWFMALRAAYLKDKKRRFSKEAAMCKVFSSETCNKALRTASKILGVHGLKGQSLFSRLVKDARVTQIYEGASEIQRIVISRSVLKNIS